MFELFRRRRELKRAMAHQDQLEQETIRGIENAISEGIGKIHRDPKNAGMTGTLGTAFMKEMEPQRNFLHQLKQRKIRERLTYAGIEIPDHYATPFGDDVVLTKKGETWARVQLRNHRNQQIEFWFKLFMPSVSLIVSIVALVLSARRH